MGAVLPMRKLIAKRIMAGMRRMMIILNGFLTMVLLKAKNRKG
jgi:type IV secretory pathway TrbD component